MKIASKNYKYHIFAWLGLAVYEVASVAVVTENFGNLESYLLHYLVNMFLFYIHSIFTLPKWVKTNKINYLMLSISILAQVIVYLLISYEVDVFIGKRSPSFFGPSGLNGQFLLSSIWRAIYFMVFATTYFLFVRFKESREKMSVLEKLNSQQEINKRQTDLELADARNAYLRAQVNPHFLLNTLTFLYNKSHKNEPRTAEAVFYLSKLLRYLINSDRGPALSAIGAEIEQVENLFQLSRVKEEEIFVEFNYSESIEDLRIIPLVLLSLAENMIKHGNLSDKQFPGIISLIQKEGKLILSTTNLINTGINDSGIHSGLDNIAQRLKHNYGSEVSINYGKIAKNYYYVEVILPLEHKLFTT